MKIKGTLYFLLTIVIVLLNTCDEKERINPWDLKNTLDPNDWSPQNLEIELISITERKLTWKYGDHNIEGFKIDRKEGDGNWDKAFATIGKEARSWNDTEIVPDESLTYSYRVYAYAGSNESEKIEINTGAAIPAPSSLKISINSVTSVSLSWQDNSTGEEGFRIDRLFNDELQAPYDSVLTNVTTYTDYDVNLDGNHYLYKVYAYYGGYISDYSEALYIPLSLTTSDVTNITVTTATSGGYVVGSHVDSRGIAYGTSPNPDVSGNTISAGSGAGSFTAELKGLNPGTNYFVRSYAANELGDFYGEQLSFYTDNGVIDIDGNVYRSVIIGNQEWLAKNLRVTKYNNGDAIPTGLINADWTNTTEGAYAIFDYNNFGADGINSPNEMVAAYGKLYNWYAVDDSRGLCPKGWRVPSDNDWTELVNYVIDQGFPNSYKTNGAGNALKSCRQVSHPYGGDCNTSEHPRWNSHSTYGFDEFGFSALPGGSHYSVHQAFDLIGYYGLWWTSTEYSSTNAWYRRIRHEHSNVYRHFYPKNPGFSVRCVRDT